MTEKKVESLLPSEPTSEKSLVDKLRLDDKASNFLFSEHREKFMTKFVIGSNELVIYGNPVAMAHESELIKSMLELDSPYYLFAHETVSEEVATVIMLYLNFYISLSF